MNQTMNAQNKHKMMQNHACLKQVASLSTINYKAQQYLQRTFLVSLPVENSSKLDSCLLNRFKRCCSNNNAFT